MTSTSKKWKSVIKLTISGDTGVGKSCLLFQYTDGRFQNVHDLTIGVDFGSKIILLSDYMKVQIWDTAGQEAFRDCARSYHRDANAAIICYDITKRLTFQHLSNWYDEVKSNNNTGVNIPFALVGLKVDLSHRREVSIEEGLAFAAAHNMLFYEISNKKPDCGDSISGMFDALAAKVITTSNLLVDATPVTISGASSWFNRNSIIGRFLPEMQGSTLLYRNVDNIYSTLAYDYGMKAWVIRKHSRKILAVSYSNNSITPPTVYLSEEDLSISLPSKIWYENSGIFLTWLFKAPTMRSVVSEEGVFNSSASTNDTDPLFKDDENMGVIDMRAFALYSREPEQLGLDVPLFVRYCHFKMSYLEFEFHRTALAQDLDRMEALAEQRQELQHACHKLLESVSMKLSDVVNEGYVKKSYSSNLEYNILHERNQLQLFLSVLCIDVAKRFSVMISLEEGNFQVARKCRDTLKELQAIEIALENISSLKVATNGEEKIEPVGIDSLSSELSHDVKEDIDLDQDSDNEESNIDTTVSVDAVLNQHPAADEALTASIRKIVVDDSSVSSSRKHKTYTIEHHPLRWIIIEELENDTDLEIDSRCKITSGFVTSSSKETGFSLSGGPCAAAFASIAAEINMNWKTSESSLQATEREQALRIPPRTKLIVEQEVMSGVLVIQKQKNATATYLGLALPVIKEKRVNFAFKKDALRYSTNNIHVPCR